MDKSSDEVTISMTKSQFFSLKKIVGAATREDDIRRGLSEIESRELDALYVTVLEITAAKLLR